MISAEHSGISTVHALYVPGGPAVLFYSEMLFVISHVLCPPPGSDVVEWLFHHIEGFSDRREARKYASNLLKAGFIRHTVNKITFSEQCYYVFGDLSDCENCE